MGNQELTLKSLSLVGNSLKTSSQGNLGRALVELLTKPSLVHLDLSHTDLYESVFKTIVVGLRYARTLQSLHITGKSQDEINHLR